MSNVIAHRGKQAWSVCIKQRLCCNTTACWGPVGPQSPTCRVVTNMRARTNRVVVCLTDEELNTLNTKVDRSGLNRSEYCRRVLSDIAVTEFSADVSFLIQELRSITRTLTQLIQEHQSENPEQLRSALNDIQTIKQTIKDAYSF